MRRDRETFYESFYERLYEPRTELGPRVRFCYTRAVTAMSPPPLPFETPRGPILVLTSLYLFLFYAAPQQVAFSLSILESASFFIIIIFVVNTSLPFDFSSFSFFSFSFFFFILFSFILRIYFIAGIFLD